MPRPPFMPSWQMAEGPEGPPGVNAIPADEFIAGRIADPVSLTRAALDALAHFFYPSAYGAVNDREVNSAAAVQACIDAAHEFGGGIVYVDGQYGWDGELLHKAVTILGPGRPRKTVAGLTSPDRENGLFALGPTALYRYGQWGGGDSEFDNPGPLQNLIIHGMDVGGATAGELVRMECVNGHIDQCDITHSAAKGLEVGRSQNSTVDRSYIGMCANDAGASVYSGNGFQGAGMVTFNDCYFATSLKLVSIQSATDHFRPHQIAFNDCLFENYTPGNDIVEIDSAWGVTFARPTFTYSVSDPATAPPPNGTLVKITNVAQPIYSCVVTFDTPWFAAGDPDPTDTHSAVKIDCGTGVGNIVNFTGFPQFYGSEVCVELHGTVQANVVTFPTSLYRGTIPLLELGVGASAVGVYSRFDVPLKIMVGTEATLLDALDIGLDGEAESRLRIGPNLGVAGRCGIGFMDGVNNTFQGTVYYDESDDLNHLGNTWRVENAWALRPLTTNVSAAGQAVTLSAAGTAAPLRYLSFVGNNFSADITLNDGVDGSQYVIEMVAVGRTGCSVTWPANIHNAPQPVDGEVVKVHLTKIGATDWWADAPAATLDGEAVDDRVAGLLVGGENVDLTYDDGAGTLTIDSNHFGSTATAAATAAKTATISGYTPATGDVLHLTLDNGNSAATPTLNINGGGAKNIYLAGFAMTATSGITVAGGIWAMRYDGTRWHMLGSPANYTIATQAEMEAGALASTRWVSPLLVKQAIDVHLNDATAAHAASAISYAGSAGLVADDVEEALDELDTEKAPLASPAFTGNPTAPTPSAADNDTSIATTAFVATAIEAVRGQIIAETNYNPAALTTITTAAASTVDEDIDATNLSVTFIVPASGNIRVRLVGTASSVTAAAAIHWMLRTTAGATVAGTKANVAANTTRVRATHEVRITGLTPGAAFTYRWGHNTSSVANAGRFYVGDDGAGSTIYGPASMVVMAD